MNVGELREFIAALPDDMPVLLQFEEEAVTREDPAPALWRDEGSLIVGSEECGPADSARFAGHPRWVPQS